MGFGFGVTGLAGGAGLYLYTMQQLNLWPMKHNPDNQSAIQRYFSGQEKKEFYASIKKALPKIEKELRFTLQEKQRTQIADDFRASSSALFSYMSQVKQHISKPEPSHSKIKSFLFGRP